MDGRMEEDKGDREARVGGRGSFFMFVDTI